MNACTIIARNYLAQARVLARTFLEHHPDSQFTVLVIDGEQPFPQEPEDAFEALTLSEIGIDDRELRRMMMIYDVMELATAVKPALLKTLLARGAEDVTYFDPDIEIFGPLDDISELARRHSIVLTPHTLEPLAHDHAEPGEVTLLLAGMFNLGFISVGSGAGEFLDWWAERVARDGHVAPARGEFVDQRWVDFVPSLFDHTLLRDPGCNVAHWNLENRRFERADGRYLVDGRPLRFFHYSGFDPERPYLLSKFLGREPRILLSENSALEHICAEYAEKLLAAGHRRAQDLPYGFGTLPNGVPINRRMRLIYYDALVQAEREGHPEPPNPFDPGAVDSFIDWLNEPVHPAAPTFTRYLADLHARRPDLRERFPDPRWLDGERLLEWAWTTGRIQEQIPVELLPEPQAERPQPPPPVSGGVNVTGYFRAEAGVGQAARHVLNGLERAGIAHTSMAYGETLSRQAHAFDDSGDTTYDVNLICVNADQLPRFTYDVGPDFFGGRHSIGLWWWEVGRFPERFHDAFEVVNEVWVGSDFVREAIAAETDLPVFTLPLGIELPRSEPRPARDKLGLTEGFLFLFSFDFDSRFERKNPLATVEAFRRAFPTGGGPTLVLKSINGDRWLPQLEQLRAAAADRSDIRVVDGYLSASDNEALMATCDCYISLHRSEGFGLTMAEAMAHGKPVIATHYSGNLDFMTDETSYLVPYRLTEIPEGVDPYPAGAEWAEPDVQAASELMRRVYEDADEAAELGRLARTHVAEQLAPERTAEFMRDRLGQIWHARANLAPPEVEETIPAAERARRYLAEGPSTPIRGASRFGFAGQFARRALYRLLRPYTVRHAEFESAVIDALGELRVELERTAYDELRARTRLSSAVERLERDRAGDERHLNDLSEHANRVERQATTLAAELHAVPYLAEPDFFLTIGPDGREALGYSGQEDIAAGPGTYRGFEDIFRGSERFVRERQRAYVDILRGHEPVLDVGCGRGELLDLLREAGIEARGIDLDEGMADHCRTKGHDVELAEATEYLERQPEHKLGAVFSAQVIEHMPYGTLTRFFALARRTLAPGGLFVAETVNPHSIPALKTFWVDLTHEKPIFPEVALALCRLHGFESARVVFPNGDGDLERDRRTRGEYAVLATVASVQAARRPRELNQEAGSGSSKSSRAPS